MTYPLRHDEPPETRNDAPTRRALELDFARFSDDAPMSAEPATRLMSPDEHDGALLGPDTGRSSGDWDDDPATPVLSRMLDQELDDGDEVDEGAAARPQRLWQHADRKTLPSARMPMTEDALGAHRALSELTWESTPAPEEPKPAREDEEVARGSGPASSPSIWGRVQRFVARLAGKRTETATLLASAAGAQSTARAISELVWTLEDGELDALARHIERVTALRRLGPEAYAEAWIRDVERADLEPSGSLRPPR